MKIGLDFLGYDDVSFLGTPYRGGLTVKQAFECMNAASRNAKELADEAEILLVHEKFARAFALAVLSLEESGKLSIILTILLNDHGQEISQKWKSYYDHKSKNSTWLLPQLNFMRGQVSIKTYNDLTSPNGKLSKIIDQMKMHSLYSTIVDKGRSLTPSERVEPELSSIFVENAKIVALEVFTFSTEAGLEIWYKHAKLGSTHDVMYSEMLEKKLITKEQMERIMENHNQMIQ